MQHSHYGDLRGDFEGDGWTFFKRAWWLWLLSPIALFIFPLAPFLYAEFKAREWRWWLDGIRIGDVRLSSNLPHDAFYGLYWKVIGWWFLLSVASGAYFSGVAALMIKLLGPGSDGLPQVQALSDNIPMLVLVGLGYVAWILALNVVMRLYLVRDMWATVLQSVQVHGIEAMANVAAKGDLASALGEGFADGLDVAGF
jgi:hypothetical protein